MSNWIDTFRPRSFKTFEGNKAAIASIKADLADAKDITHTWLITGAFGFGKTTLAYIIARKLLEIPFKQELDKHPDFEEINANEKGSKESIVELIQNSKFLPKKASYRVVLIDEAHKLSSAAASALLKVLESPPKHVIFILATNEEDKILKTVRDRAKKIVLEELTEEELVSLLTRIVEREDLEFITPKILKYIASQFTGRTRQAIILLKDLAKRAKANKGKVDTKNLEQALEEVIETDYAIGGGILENLYLGNPGEACKICAKVKDMQHVVNTMLDLNNALIQQVTGVPTYYNAVRKKLFTAVKSNKNTNLMAILTVQNNLFSLKKELLQSPVIDPAQLLLYHVSLTALELKRKEK